MEHILPFAAEYGLLPREETILCALSGGPDSVALLHFLKTHGFHVEAAHFDHHLRPTSSRDAAHAQALCQALDVPFHLGQGRVGELPGNTEANAREARYAFLVRTAEQIGATRVATGHNANDNLETVLLHLTRGCGLRGLCGIPPIRPLSPRCSLVRPLLHTPRTAIEAYVSLHKLPSVLDETNLDDAYIRNRIRHQAVPVLAGINPRVTEAVARMTGYLRADMRRLSNLETLEGEGERDCLVLEETAVEVGRRVETPLWTLTTAFAVAPPIPPTAHAFALAWPFPQATPSRPLRDPASPPCPPLSSPLSPPFPPGSPPASPCPEPLLAVRERRPGDRLHPPNRSGKTVKKWMNELKVPKWARNAVPVLVLDGNVVSVAGIGPDQGALARPGEPAILVTWEKTPEK